jgi:serine/threonine protein kinase
MAEEPEALGIVGTPEIVSEPLIELSDDLPLEAFTLAVTLEDPHTSQPHTAKIDPLLVDPPLYPLRSEQRRLHLDNSELKPSSIELGAQIGAGGQNVVLEAHHTHEETVDQQYPGQRRLVAVIHQPTLRIPRGDSLLDINKTLAAFRLGAQAFANANNDRVPGIPLVVDIKAARVNTMATGVRPENFLLPVIVMERGDRDLGSAPMSSSELVRMCTQVTIGLRYLAAKFSISKYGEEQVQEPIFNDIRPQNILQFDDYDKDGKIINTRYAIIDAESYLLLPETQHRKARTNDRSELMLSPFYSAPESLSLEDLPVVTTGRSIVETGRAKLYAEQFSLAVTLLELISQKPGQPVNQRHLNVDRSKEHLFDLEIEKIFPGDNRPNLKRFFSRALSVRPADRFETLAQFHLAFMTAMRDDKEFSEAQFAEQMQELKFHESRLFRERKITQRPIAPAT